jgi:hypothetical protein
MADGVGSGIFVGVAVARSVAVATEVGVAVAELGRAGLDVAVGCVPGAMAHEAISNVAAAIDEMRTIAGSFTAVSPFSM